MSLIIPLIDSALDMASAVVEHMNLKEQHKYIDRVRELRLELLREESKPESEINDALIERIEATLRIDMSTMNTAIALGVKGGKT